MRHLKKDSAFSAFFAILNNSLERTRRCGRAVECTGLENRRRLIADREFESHHLRQENGPKYLIFRAFFVVSACNARLLYRRSPRRETYASSAAPEASGEVSMCAIKPIAGAASQPAVAGIFMYSCVYWENSSQDRTSQGRPLAHRFSMLSAAPVADQSKRRAAASVSLECQTVIHSISGIDVLFVEASFG